MEFEIYFGSIRVLKTQGRSCAGIDSKHAVGCLPKAVH